MEPMASVPSARLPARTVLSRGLAARCPACGRGSVFVRGVESARVCPDCGWRLERCHGHWVGGNEINLLATFPVGIAAFAVSALAFGLGPVSVTLATIATGTFSLAFYRSSRGLFFALDYLIDPAPDLSSMPPTDPGDLRDPRPDDDPPPPAPYPPPATVSP